jgi:ribosomal protein RSM22 (predicted rRNA methylase)
VQLPDNVRRAIDDRAESVGFAALKRAADAISAAYRANAPPPRLAAAERVAAYLATRMPATYAAAHAVIGELRRRLEGCPITSVLDIGAGTGAASLAVREFFPEARITLVERDAAFAEAARQWLPEAALVSGDITQLQQFPPHDLVIAAYSLGEVQRPPIAQLWAAARVALVVIEPGTPKGFSFIRGIRDELLASGARMAAPCPAESPCPLPASDWCHFGARVERSSIHRRLKDAGLNYEDEKYSYVALAREAATLPEARIIRRPEHRPGLITLQTCTPSGIAECRVTRRDRDLFRAARKASWGDAW